MASAVQSDQPPILNSAERVNLSTSNPTIEKVKNFFMSVKDKIVSGAMFAFNYCKTHILSCNNSYAPRVKGFLSTHKITIVAVISTLLLCLFAIAMPKLAMVALIWFTVSCIVNYLIYLDTKAKSHV